MFRSWSQLHDRSNLAGTFGVITGMRIIHTTRHPLGPWTRSAPLAATFLTAGLLAAGCSSASSPPASGSPAISATPAASSSSTPASVASPTSAATSAAAAGGSGSGTSAGTAACTSAHLQASLGGGAGVGMSQDHTGLQLRNTGSAPCTLDGYPGVSWVAGADGHQVGAPAARQANISGSPEKTITLAPGAVASAPLDLVEGGGGLPASQCKPVPVRGLRVYPPGERAALFISAPTPAGGFGECSKVTTAPMLSIGYLQLGVQPGGGGAG